MSDLLLIEINLLEDVVLEEVIGAEDLEASLVVEICELNIDKVLEGFHVAMCDQLG